MSASWSWVVGPWSGGPQYELTSAKARKATFDLTDPSQASCTLDGHNSLSQHVVELVTDLHLLRRPQLGWPAERVFRGRVGPTGDDVDADQHTVSVSALDYRAVLNRRRLWSDSTLTWAGIDQADLVAALLADTQGRPGGDLGITVAGGPTGVPRDRTYKPRDKIGELIQQLSEIIDGFDWDVLPTSGTGLVLQLWQGQRGTARGVVLERGGLVETVSRTVDPGDYANALGVTGQAPEGGEEPAPVEVAAADIASRAEGRWDSAVGESITTAPALAERADWLLGEQQVIRPSYTVKLRAGMWRGPSHIWLGDPVRLVVMSRPRLAVDTTLRVRTVAVDLGDDGSEDVTLTLGPPRPDFARRAADTERRLADLERR